MCVGGGVIFFPDLSAEAKLIGLQHTHTHTHTVVDICGGICGVISAVFTEL